MFGIGSTELLVILVVALLVLGPKNLPKIAHTLGRAMGEFEKELGCDLCKVFPGDVYGPNFVKGMMAPMPWSKIMVTGGVEPSKENLTAWVKAGVFCVGMGSKLFPKDKVAAEDWQYVTDKCKEALGYIAEARK